MLYTMITHYFPSDFAKIDDFEKKQAELDKLLKEYAEVVLQSDIQKLEGGYEWEVVSHSVSFLENRPVATILLRCG